MSIVKGSWTVWAPGMINGTHTRCCRVYKTMVTLNNVDEINDFSYLIMRYLAVVPYAHPNTLVPLYKQRCVRAATPQSSKRMLQL